MDDAREGDRPARRPERRDDGSGTPGPRGGDGPVRGRGRARGAGAGRGGGGGSARGRTAGGGGARGGAAARGGAGGRDGTPARRGDGTGRPESSRGGAGRTAGSAQARGRDGAGRAARVGGPRGGGAAARGAGRPERGRDGVRPARDRVARPDRSDEARATAPTVPEDVEPRDLDPAARARLRTLRKDNADAVARHLVMAGRLLDDDPEAAYAHAAEAARRAGRVDVVREAAGIAAYRTGRYAEALRELRTARRLGGSDDHVPLMADCERGLGRPERAIALAAEHAGRLAPEVAVELAIVVSGARLDLGQPEAALAALSTPEVRSATGEAADRVAEARATALAACGRHAEAEALLATLPEEPVVVIDLADEDADADDGGTTDASDTAAAQETSGDAVADPTHEEPTP